MTPEAGMARSTADAYLRKDCTSSSEAKPITRSTLARMYQLRSERMISPAAGRWGR
jgi:hypothetical protein